MTVLLLGIGIEWIILMIIIPLAQRLADFSLPPLGERAWKLLVILALAALANLGGAIVHGLLGWIAGLIVFWIGLVKVFEVDLFGAVIIIVLRMLVNWLIVGVLVTLLFTAAV